MQRVLIFDVNADRIAHLITFLDGYDILVTSQRSRAVRLVVERRPDIIFADWYQSDGHGLIQELRRLRGICVPPVVLMEDIHSSERRERLEARARAYGAFGLILRPVDMNAPSMCAIVNQRGVRTANDGSECITIYGSPNDALMTDEQSVTFTDSPLMRVAELVGGMVVIVDVLDRLKIHSSKHDLHRLWKAIDRWGSMAPDDMFIHAVELTYTTTEKEDDPVDAALFVLAVNATTLCS